MYGGGVLKRTPLFSLVVFCQASSLLIPVDYFYIHRNSIHSMAGKDLQYLMQRLRASDEEAFKEIFDVFQESIFRYLYFKCKNVQVAEDLLQEVFYKLWKNRNTLNPSQSIKSYLYTLAENLFLNFCRHEKVVKNHLQAHHDATESHLVTPEYLLEEEEFRSQLENAIALLPDKVREVYMLSRMEDLSYQEIAERQSISIKTVESHMVKALRMLRETLQLKYFDKKTG
jgi:RNA polymerase sigma-70 factor (ECF subfamily)